MRLWVLRDDTPDWDEYAGYVIRADTEERARLVAAVGPWGDPNDPDDVPSGTARESKWCDAERTTCEPIGDIPGDEGIVLAAFNAG